MTTRRNFILQSAAAGFATLPIEGMTQNERSRATSAEASVAGALVRARLEARLLEHYPGSVPSDLSSGYRYQDAAIARWPRPIGGWKVSGRQAPTQEQLFGPAFEGNIRSAAPGEVVECPMFMGGMAGFEPEVIVRVGQDAPPGQTVWRLVEAAEMVGELCIGAEVTSSPLPRLLELGLPAIVSDFCGNFGIVVGSAIPNWQRLDEITARSYVGDELVGQGTRPVRDGILEIFRSALAHCARRGYPLRAGMLIATGSLQHSVGIAPPPPPPIPTPTQNPAPTPIPAQVRADRGVQPLLTSRMVFDGLGEFTCRAVPATPYSDDPKRKKT